MPKFPKTYYVKFESGGDGPDYPVPYDTAMGCAELGERITVGVYRLVETQVVEGTIEVSKKRSRA